jgi:hypothetical protein
VRFSTDRANEMGFKADERFEDVVQDFIDTYAKP